MPTDFKLPHRSHELRPNCGRKPRRRKRAITLGAGRPRLHRAICLNPDLSARAKAVYLASVFLKSEGRNVNRQDLIRATGVDPLELPGILAELRAAND